MGQRRSADRGEECALDAPAGSHQRRVCASKRTSPQARFQPEPANEEDIAVRRFAVVALTIVAGGCSETPGADVPVVRDSAGVQIAENPSAALDNAPTWRLELLQEVVDDQLYRVNGVTRLPDGSIAVSNHASSEVRIYEPDSRFARGLGGEGEGPGEFRGLGNVWRLGGDTILAWDYRLRRASLYTTDGHHLRDFKLPGEESYPLEVFEDQTLLVRESDPFVPFEGSRALYSRFLRYDLDGRLLDSLGRYPSGRRVRYDLPRFRATWGPPHFGAALESAVGPRGYWVGTAEAYEIWRYEPTGEPAQLVRWEGPDRTVTEEDRSRYREARLGAAEGSERTREFFDARPFAEQFPAYHQLLVDPGSRLWVRLYRPFYRTFHQGGPGEWLIFDPDGRLVARAETPDGFWVHEIGEDYVLGVSWNEMDVERVRLYGLRRGERG